jgi:hypothetical protein
MRRNSISCIDSPRYRKHGYPELRFLVFADGGVTLPKILLDRITAIDPDAQIKRTWNSVVDELEKNSLDAHDIVIESSDDMEGAAARIDHIWRLRVKANYAMRPAYLVIGKPSHPMARFEIERRGGYFLRLCDVPTHLVGELEHIRLGFGPLARSLPRWHVVREGVGLTARASVFLLTRQKPRVRGGNLCSAVLAVLLKNNGMPRSICEIQKLLEEDPLFKPAGGSFAVPSFSSLKMYLHRAYPKYLQEAFDLDRSGYSANWVIEREKLDQRTMGYKIRGECLPTTYFEY